MDLLCLCLFTLFNELYITNSLVRKPCSFVNQIQAKMFSMLFRHTKKKNKENSFLNLAWYSFTSLVTNYATCMTTLLLLHTKIRKIIFTNTLTNRSYSNIKEVQEKWLCKNYLFVTAWSPMTANRLWTTIYRKQTHTNRLQDLSSYNLTSHKATTLRNNYFDKMSTTT